MRTKPKTSRQKKRYAAKAMKDAENRSIPASKALGGAVVLILLFIAYGLFRGGTPQTSQTNIQESTTQPTTTPTTTTEASTPGMQPVSVIILNDKRCGQYCNITSIVNKIKSQFPMYIRNLDYSSTEGQRVYENAGLNMLPAILFDSSVRHSSGYQNLSAYLESAGTYLSLRIKSSWDPYCDPTPDHCNEEKCSGRISCVQEMPGKLDIYLLSQNVYGIIALDSMKTVLGAFKGEVNFTLNYIGSVGENNTPIAIDSPREAGEDLLALCTARYYPGDYKYMNYIWCRNENLTDNDWQRCATDNGMNAAIIQACAEGDEGKGLLLESFRRSQELGISTVPTFMVNNKNRIPAITPEQIQAAVCSANSDFRGCSYNLTAGH